MDIVVKDFKKFVNENYGTFDILKCINGLQIYNSGGLLDFLNNQGRHDISEYVLNLEHKLYQNKDYVLFKLNKSLGGNINSIKFSLLTNPEVAIDIITYMGDVPSTGNVSVDNIDYSILQGFFRCGDDITDYQLKECFCVLILLSIIDIYDSELKKM